MFRALIAVVTLGCVVVVAVFAPLGLLGMPAALLAGAYFVTTWHR
jgi:hypothetical protein